MKDMEFSEELVTPDMARAWLALSAKNRNISQTTVNRYADDMKNNRWRRSKQAISFNTDGELDDGQHRLEAIVLSGVPVLLSIVRNAPVNQFEVLDTGRTRQIGQVLTLKGYPAGSSIAAITRLVLRFELFPNKIWSSRTAPITGMEIIEYLDTHDIDVSGIDRVRKLRVVPATPWMACRHIILTSAPSCDRWDEFSDGVMIGANVPAFDPRLALRNNRGQRWGEGQSDMMIIIKAWNYWLNGRTVEYLKSDKGSIPIKKPE